MSASDRAPHAPHQPARYLYFVRHGQAKHVGDGFHNKLTPLGRKQARLTARRLAQWPIAALYSSDMPRAVESAEIIAPMLGGLRLRRMKLLREMTPSAIPGARSAALRAHASAWTGLSRLPIRSIVTTTVSPSFRNSGGFLEKPTPDGVPVKMTVPGKSVVP